MDPVLRAFIRANFVERPEAVCPVKDIVHGLRASLPQEAVGDWSRSRVIAELSAAGFTIGNIGRVAHVAGLAPRGVEWQLVDGRLEAAHA